MAYVFSTWTLKCLINSTPKDVVSVSFTAIRRSMNSNYFLFASYKNTTPVTCFHFPLHVCNLELLFPILKIETSDTNAQLNISSTMTEVYIYVHRIKLCCMKRLYGCFLIHTQSTSIVCDEMLITL